MPRRLVFRVDSASGAPSALGPLESRVMDVLWSQGEWQAVSDVMPRLLYARGESPLAYTTIKTILSNLAGKGYLAKKSAGRANVFKPKRSREQYQRDLIDQVVRPLMKTQRNPLLAHIAAELADDDETYAEFEKLLAEKRAERGR